MLLQMNIKLRVDETIVLHLLDYHHAETLYQLVKINCSDIEYIESMGDYIRIHQTTDKPVMSLMTLKAVLDKLPASVFKRIHRSYIVNTDKIRSVISRRVKLSSGTELPVSDSYLDVVKAWKQV